MLGEIFRTNGMREILFLFYCYTNGEIYLHFLKESQVFAKHQMNSVNVLSTLRF